MAPKFRFVGGRVHGQRLPAYGQREVHMPIPPRWADVVVRESWSAQDVHRVEYERYERREVAFDSSCRLAVYALVGMSEAEFWRRIADLVEGV